MSKRHARELRRNPTAAERTLWRHIRLRQLERYKFRRQQPIGKYIVDFVCLEKNLILELDGGQHAERTPLDAERTMWLEAQGYRVLRFWNHELLTDVEAVTEAIRKELNTR